MSTLLAKAVIRDALDDQSAALAETYGASIRSTNTTFDPAGAPWIEIRFPGARTDRLDIGETAAPLWEEVGAFMVDVYVPTNTAEDLADAIADAVWGIYRGQDLSGVRCDARMAGQSGPREPFGQGTGVWWGLSFGVSYRFQTVG